MLNDPNFISRILIFGGSAVAALFLGFFLADPLSGDSLAAVSMCFLVLTLPFMLKMHYPFLIFAWNAFIVVPFLPGQPKLVFLVSAVSLGLAIVSRTLSKQTTKRPRVPGLTYALVFFGLAVLITAFLRGGFGASSLGGQSSGAKRYLGVIGPVLGYFALTSQSIPRRRALLYCSLFLLSGLTAIVSDAVFAAGPAYYFLFNIFPTELAIQQATTQSTLYRLAGVTEFAFVGCNFLLMRYGISGIFEWKKPWRALLFLGFLALSLLGGFRSALLIVGLVCLIQCFLEGAVKRPVFVGLIVGGLCIGGLSVAFVDKMPLAVQRSLSFLPLENIDPSVRADAKATIEWRLNMWPTLVAEIPQYLLLGKGFSYSTIDHYLMAESIARGHRYLFEERILITGNYHNGPLTILIPFGIWGFLGFIWFCVSALKVLYKNYRYGDPSIRRMNTFLFSFFVGRLIYFTIFYGQLDLDFVLFVGIVGFSLALNGGVSKPSTVPVQSIAPEPLLRQRSALAI